MYPILHHVILFALVLATGDSNRLKTAREQHQPQLSTNSDYRHLESRSNTNYINQVLDHILVPRVAGTQGHEKVFAYIVKELRKLKWAVDVDEFVARAPIFGEVTFKNIIATPNPGAERYLVLACHYDSKYFKNVVFVGATDSAVPCAMMLDLAATLNKELSQNRDSSVGLKLVFFDGEEAFKHWGPNDSIYGAKHLAEKLANNRTRVENELVSELDRFDVLVLLDLIGAKNPVFLKFFEDTSRWFLRLAQIEQELHRERLLKNHQQNYFQLHNPYGRVEDDHIPFLQRGVPIVHVIATPFPREWHTPNDNRDIVDLATVHNINLILKAFVCEYLHLSLAEPSTLQDFPQQELSLRPSEVSREHPAPLLVVFIVAVGFFIYINLMKGRYF